MTIISNISSESTVPNAMKVKFYLEPLLEEEKKVSLNFQGHMAKMAAMPIYGKNVKKNLLKNQKSYDLDTWHAACGTKASQNLNKWWSWIALDLFFGKVKFCCLCIWIGKTYKRF